MKQITKIGKEFIVLLTLMAIMLGFGAVIPAQAATEYLPLPKQAELCGTGSFPCPEGETGVDIAKNLTAKIIYNVRIIVGAVAIVMIIVAGVKLIAAGGNEEEFTKQTTALTFGLIGLALVGLAGELASIFEVDRGGFLKDPNVTLQKSRIFSRTVEIIVTFIKYIIGSVAVLIMIRSGLRLMVFGGNEEEVGKDKKNIFYALLGLVFIMLSDTIINKVFFKIDTSQYPGTSAVRPGIDTKRLVGEIAGVTNLIAAITGPFALLSLVVGGLMYTLAAGEEEKIGKAKKIIMWSLIGIVIIYGSFAIVSTFVARKFEGL